MPGPLAEEVRNIKTEEGRRRQGARFVAGKGIVRSSMEDARIKAFNKKEEYHNQADRDTFYVTSLMGTNWDKP